MEITARNINSAVGLTLPKVIDYSNAEESRVGNVIVCNEPVTITYLMPTERVLFSPTRDANPFFHLMESLWMLAGHNDLLWPVFFNSKFASYSDDLVTLHGAYGYRWRNYFEVLENEPPFKTTYDQLQVLIEELTRSPNSRRAVLEMWSAVDDLPMLKTGGKDVPCNTHAYFDLRHGVLNMTVCNRSNDALWGCFGANAVHFSLLQEYLAAWLKVPVGVYRQFTNNLHIYTDVFDVKKVRQIALEGYASNHYPFQGNNNKTLTTVYPLVNTSIEAWDADLERFLAKPEQGGYNDPFFNEVAMPMYMAWHARKHKLGDGRVFIDVMAECDWKLACQQWIDRRAK